MNVTISQYTPTHYDKEELLLFLFLDIVFDQRL
jgi:hypothetical protein